MWFGSSENGSGGDGSGKKAEKEPEFDLSILDHFEHEQPPASVTQGLPEFISEEAMEELMKSDADLGPSRAAEKKPMKKGKGKVKKSMESAMSALAALDAALEQGMSPQQLLDVLEGRDPGAPKGASDGVVKAEPEDPIDAGYVRKKKRARPELAMVSMEEDEWEALRSSLNIRSPMPFLKGRARAARAQKESIAAEKKKAERSARNAVPHVIRGVGAGRTPRDGVMTPVKAKRAAERFKTGLNGVLSSGAFSDPRLISVGLYVSEVRPSPDGRNLTVYWACAASSLAAEGLPAGEAALDLVQKSLIKANGRIRKLLLDRVGIVYAPKIRWIPDPGLARSIRLDRLLSQKSGDGDKQ